MESHKKLFKNTRNVPTLRERMKKINNRREKARNNIFAANRNIE